MSRRRLALTLIGLLVVVFGSLAGNLIAGNEPSLGLDLQGGVSVTQEPVGEFNTESLDLAVERIRERVDSLGVAEPEIIRQGNAIVVNLPGVENQDEAIRLVQVTGAVLLRPVLASQAIDTTVTTVAPDASTTVADAQSTSTSSSTSTTPVTSTADTTTTVPAGPARPLAPTTVDPGSSTTVVETTTVAPDTSVPSTDVALVTEAPLGSTTDSTVPSSMPDPTDPTATVFVQNADGSEFFQLGPAFATGEVFNSDAQADIISGGWGVRVTLRGGASGADLWNVGASKCFSRDTTCPTGRMAIVLDGVVQSAPTVNQPTFTGGVDITGSFSESEAKDLARVLKSGALPVRLQVQAVQTVSPTLGSDSLRAAIISGLIGVGLVLLFMLIYYRSLAAVVVVGLVISGSIQWNVISLLSRTNGLALSLAGIAGIIVSIGVTVDSYVVFFEKLKDEVKSGRTLRNSAERGFKSAWRTILAADIVSLLGAFTLWYLTVGSVRGFAFFLGLSTLCDLVVAWFFTRPAMLLLARSEFIARRRVFGVDPSTLTTGGAS
ncbi:MAG: protein translocase subunit SecD [Actinobacteria bacterium]|nr:protein translocase subunit SecD [Actinomycetota bacterium]